MKEIFEELEAEVDQNAVNRKHDEIERKKFLIANDNLIADCLSKDVFYIATNSELTVSRFTEMHDAHTIFQAHCLELEAELSKLHDKVVQIVLWYLDSGCSKHMTGDRSQLRNFMKKFIGTVRFRNDHFGAIMGYGDYMIGDSVISRVYFVEGLRHNLFIVGQFCDSDQEVTFRKHSCYVRNIDGVELIKGSYGSNLYTILVEDMMKSSPICLLSKASKHKSCVSIFHQKSILRTPQQNDVVERQNHTLVEVAWTILIFSKAPMLLWAEVVSIACYTQNQSLIQLHHAKTHQDRLLGQFRIFSQGTDASMAEDLGKLQPTADIEIFVGYAPSMKGYRIYNKRTRRIMETIHIQFDELYEPMAPVKLTSPSHSPSSSALQSPSSHQGC
ncbi:integrase, catalytic region, zinc finger, CCHC-type containing protein [Tanacetum coccineum]